MSDIPNVLRAELEYNSTNLGEFGLFIRLEYVYSLLEHYKITDSRPKSVSAQLNTPTEKQRKRSR